MYPSSVKEDVFRIVPKIINIFANWSRRENIINDLFPDKPIRQILGEHEASSGPNQILAEKLKY